MLLDLLRNIKQAALTHALSTAIVVQGVAVQQTTTKDFSVMEAEILESSLEQKEQAQEVAANDNGASESYWQEIREMASVSESVQEASSQSIEPLVALYEDPDPSEYVPTQSQSASGSAALVTSSLVAVTSNAPIAIPSVEAANGERAKAPSRPQAQAGAGSANNLQVPEVLASQEAQNAKSSSAGSSDASSLDRQIASSAQTAAGGAKDASEETVSESSNDGDSEEVSQGGTEEEGQQEEGTQGESEEGSEEESNEESEEEPTAYEHLGSVYLVVNGQVSEIEITDNSVLELEANDEYSIVVASEEDFGSVVFNLENIESLAVHNQVENQIPYALNSDTGNQSSIRPYDFEGASYQLDLTAYDGNGVGGEILERRTIRFSVTLLDNQSGEEGNSGN